MPSFQITISPTKRAAARYISAVRRALQKALVEENRKRGLTQSDIARALNVHRSVINRELRGQADISLGRVGELAHILGRKATFALPEIQQREGANIPAVAPSGVTYSLVTNSAAASDKVADIIRQNSSELTIAAE